MEIATGMKIQDYTPDVVIVGGGDFPTHPIPLSILHNSRLVVCCDGAAYEYIPRFGKPWRIVGDCDSIFAPQNDEQRMVLEENRDIIRRFEEQDNNDQTKAVRYCIDHGLYRIAIVGATGGREDHTLGNISLLLEYKKMGAKIRLYTDHGVFIPCHDKIQLEVPIPADFQVVTDKDAYRQKSTQLSIFNFGAKNLKSEGLRYPIYDFTKWWEGTLNEVVSSPFSIEGDGDFLVYVCFTPS